MLRRTVPACVALLVCMPLALIGADSQASPSQTLTAQQIVEKNVAARGGLEAWRAVQTMSMTGKIDAGGKNNTRLPFLMELKRPSKTRFEIEFAGKTAVQVYDGANGWKLRPYLGRNDVEPFTAEEMKKASEQQGLDGFLIDFAAKGTRVELVGVEQVEGHDAYKLKLTLKGGQEHHLWVDAQSFLEVKLEGNPQRLDGKPHKVETYFRDYKAVDGLMVPFVIETAVEGVKVTHKIVVEKAVINPRLAETAFDKPMQVLAANPASGLQHGETDEVSGRLK